MVELLPPPSGACGLVCGLLSIERKLSLAFLLVRTMLTPSGAIYLAGALSWCFLAPHGGPLDVKV
jgi:hypothetical protein